MEFYDNHQFIIQKIDWERIFLKIEIKGDYIDGISFALAKIVYEENAAYNKQIADRKIEKIVKIDYDNYQNSVYFFELNTSSMDKRSFLENGEWQIIAIIGSDYYSIGVTTNVGYHIEELSRVFRYGNGKFAYNVSFGLTNSREGVLELYMYSCFMIENKYWKKRRYIKEAILFRNKIKRFYMFLVIRCIRVFYYLISRFLPKNGDKVLFMSETRNYLWGNLKYIHDRIIERELDKRFDLSVSCRASVGQHSSLMSWVKAIYRIARNDYIFIDDYAPLFGFFKLSPKTKLIQVWHAGEGFKSVGYSRFGKAGSPFPSESCHKAYDYALTGSEKLVHVYEEVFGIEKEAFLPVGMPRLDDFLDEEKILSFKKEFYEEYPHFINKKIILFAPTFRGTGQKEAYYDYDKLDLQQIYDFCGDEHVFLIKMHPFVKERIEIKKQLSDRIFDFAEYPNINDLYYITDLLITDYSSNYYEYALMRKPVIFYTYDREMYELTRGVHRSVKEHAPGKVCDTFDELINALKKEDFESDKIQKFIEENFKEYDGHACDRVIDTILLKKEN